MLECCGIYKRSRVNIYSEYIFLPKKYAYVCTTISTNTTVVIESFKTTKLESKGYRDYFTKKDSVETDFKDCLLE
jgi:hypothetical protein